MSQTRIERRIRLAGVLVLTGLLLSIVSMLWNHPLSFASLHMLALLLVKFTTRLFHNERIIFAR